MFEFFITLLNVVFSPKSGTKMGQTEEVTFCSLIDLFTPKIVTVATVCVKIYILNS